MYTIFSTKSGSSTAGSMFDAAVIAHADFGDPGVEAVVDAIQELERSTLRRVMRVLGSEAIEVSKT